MASFSLQELANFLGRRTSESPGPLITGVKPVEYAAETDITYVSSERYLGALSASLAIAVIVSPGLNPGGLPHIVSGNPEADFARLTALYYPYRKPDAGVSSKADVHPDSCLGEEISIGPFSVIGKGCVIGNRSVIGAHVVVGEDVRIGEDTRIFPNVTIYPKVTVGSRVIIHSGTVIGADGFGFCRDVNVQGNHINVKKHHSGTVLIEDDVEIGALCAVDRALAGVTRIGRGVKLDNLVQVAHNVSVDVGTVVASQSGIAGSSSVGKFCIIAGQVGIRDHVQVGDGVILATRVGIYRNIPDGSIMAGSVPAMPHKLFLRAQPLFKRLPEILERIRKLERLIGSIGRENA
jgi:UDP-3-O-[3-hydroxymyristoyl] glucosamine N-acyltransferase